MDVRCCQTLAIYACNVCPVELILLKVLQSKVYFISVINVDGKHFSLILSYLSPPWIKCELESQDLLSICLKRVKGLNRVKMVDAGFVWTEPHSKRIKMKITIQKEVQANSILQSAFVVELVVENLQCDDCKKTWTPHTWNSVVQLRQKIDHKRTILYLEQLILKHNMHAKAINVKEQPDGIDFFFATKTHALMLNDFIHSQVVSEARQSKQLVSADISSNDYNYKHTYYIELAPVCREDLVFLPPKLQRELGGASPIALVTKVATLIQLLDPINRKSYTLDDNSYWSHGFKAICTRKQLSEFVILNVDEQYGAKSAKAALNVSKVDEAAHFNYVDLELQRISDFGENETRVFAKSHLGNVLKIGDHIWGYDMESLNSFEVEGLKKNLPDVIVVRKCYAQKKTNNKKRIWKLKHIDKEAMEDTRVNKKLEERNVRVPICNCNLGKRLSRILGRSRRRS